MRRYGRLKKNITAVGLVILLVVFVYVVTTAINAVSADDPPECSDALIIVKDACFNTQKSAFDNFQTTVRLSLQNREKDINGFSIKIFGERGVHPVVIFRTLGSLAEATLSAPYDKAVYGEIRKIEIDPIINLNQNIVYCASSHGSSYEEEVLPCGE